MLARVQCLNFWFVLSGEGEGAGEGGGGRVTTRVVVSSNVFVQIDGGTVVWSSGVNWT